MLENLWLLRSSSELWCLVVKPPEVWTSSCAGAVWVDANEPLWPLYIAGVPPQPSRMSVKSLVQKSPSVAPPSLGFASPSAKLDLVGCFSLNLRKRSGAFGAQSWSKMVQDGAVKNNAVCAGSWGLVSILERTSSEGVLSNAKCCRKQRPGSNPQPRHRRLPS